MYTHLIFAEHLFDLHEKKNGNDKKKEQPINMNR